MALSLDQFWRRFVAEITPQFHCMNKWQRELPNLKIGDVVLVLEKDDRARWPLARITAVTKTDRDGLVRRVQIRMGGVLVERSSQGLLLLESMTTAT